MSILQAIGLFVTCWKGSGGLCQLQATFRYRQQAPGSFDGSFPAGEDPGNRRSEGSLVELGLQNPVFSAREDDFCRTGCLLPPVRRP